MMRLLPVISFITLLACSQNGSGQDENSVAGQPEKSGANVVDTVVYEIHSIEAATALIDSLNYTPEAWQSGIREVPRLNWVEVPRRWREEVAPLIEVRLKKQLFFRVVAPLALESNEMILEDRRKLEELSQKNPADWNNDEQAWFSQLAERYKEDPGAGNVEALLEKVDVVPVSLALAQCAEESGWGTSRFAAEGNALFGQWAWGKDAMKPKEQRSGMGDYGLRRFDSPLESMQAYMLNLNTHNAYKPLRDERARLRSSGEDQVTGPALAKTLTKYSERGEEYVSTLLSIMRVNHLEQADEAYLSDGPVILVIPSQ